MLPVSGPHVVRYALCVLFLASAGQALNSQISLAPALTASAPPKTSKSCSVRTAPLTPGELAVAHGDYDQAVLLYNAESKASGSEPGRTNEALIRALLADNKFQDAATDANAWIKSSPSDSWTQTALGEVQLRQGAIPAAYESLRNATIADPCNPQAHAVLARVLSLQAMFASAKRSIDLAHSLDPIDPAIQQQWISFLPREQKLAEISKLLEHDQLLTPKDKTSLERVRARLKEPPEDSCHLMTPITSAVIPYRAIRDGSQGGFTWGLNVEFEGKARRLTIDTGATGLILTKEAASALKLEPVEELQIGGIGSEGSVQATLAKVKSIKIGPLEFQNCEVQVLAKERLVTPDGFTSRRMYSDGLIGGDVFRDFLLTLDFPGRQLKVDPLPIRPEDEAAKAIQGLGTGPASEIKSLKDRYVSPEMANWTRIYRSGHELLLPTRLNQGPIKLFLIDTGASNAISPAAAREVSAHVSSNSEISVSGISGEVKKVYQTGPVSLTFGGLMQQTDAMISIDTDFFSNGTGVEVSGFLGKGTLHHLTVHIDYRDNLVRFDYDASRLQHCMGGISRERGRDLPDCVR